MYYTTVVIKMACAILPVPLFASTDGLAQIDETRDILIEFDILKPQFVHNCTGCTFLGRWSDHDESMDLYHCPQGTIWTVIGRRSDDGGDYTSGQGSVLPCLIEAERRARRKGLIP